ncbi:MAG: phospholipase D-like domain-containing protein [Candidatus Omnitrophota bacterium]
MKSKIVIVVFVVTLTLIGGGFCFSEEIYSAKVNDISDREYEKAVIELIDNAEESVVIGMYHISTQLDVNNPVKLLLNDLVEAEDRGVQVRIYLNTKFPDVSYEELVGKDEFKRLKEAGCELYFIPHGRKLHDKVVIVDSRFVVEGSMNWSVVALRNNFESATLIDSPDLAKEKIARLERIYRQQREKEEVGEKERKPLYVDSITDKVEVKKALLEDEKYFPGMLKASDRRAMDLYLILLAYSQKLKKNEFFLNLEDTALGLRLPVSWDDESLRRQVIRALRTLKDRYNLIEVEFYHASDAYITILPVAGKSFTIETNIVDSHDKEIPQRLKFLLLVNALLEKEGKDLDSIPQKEIMQRFHIAERTLEKALADLRRQ